MSLIRSRYIQLTLQSRNGPVTLTIFSPADALWICEQIQQLTDNLHAVQSAVINVGSSFIVLERETDHTDLRFWAQCYRPVAAKGNDEDAVPELEVLDYYPTIML